MSFPPSWILCEPFKRRDLWTEHVIFVLECLHSDCELLILLGQFCLGLHAFFQRSNGFISLIQDQFGWFMPWCGHFGPPSIHRDLISLLQPWSGLLFVSCSFSCAFIVQSIQYLELKNSMSIPRTSALWKMHFPQNIAMLLDSESSEEIIVVYQLRWQLLMISFVNKNQTPWNSRSLRRKGQRGGTIPSTPRGPSVRCKSGVEVLWWVAAEETDAVAE